MPAPHPLKFLESVENVDPRLKDRLKETLTPKGIGAVARSDHFVFIVCNALRGFTPLEISEALEKEKKEFIQPNVIRDYILQHIPAELVRPNLIFKYLGQGSLDEVQVLETATKMQLAKVAANHDRPMVTDEAREGARRDLELLVKAAQASLDAKLKTGRVSAAPAKIEHTVTGEVKHIPMPAEIEKLDARKAANVLSALKLLNKPDA